MSNHFVDLTSLYEMIASQVDSSIGELRDIEGPRF